MSWADLARLPFERPSSLGALCGRLSERHAAGQRTVLLAGGTDVIVELKQAPPCAAEELPLVLDIGRLDELRGIERIDAVVRIGAACTYSDLIRDPLVAEWLPLLARMGRDVGGPTIQSRGTLGGNLATASPAADGVAALAAYDAVVVVQSARGARRIPFAELQSGYKQSTRQPDEVLVAFEIVPPPAGAPWYWRKVGARRAQAISKVAVAGVVGRADGSARHIGLAACSVAPVTALLPRTRALLGTTAVEAIRADELDGAVAQDVSPIDDLRSTREYRAHCAQALVREFARELGAAV